jgi:hypothetical protein
MEKPSPGFRHLPGCNRLNGRVGGMICQAGELKNKPNLNPFFPKASILIAVRQGFFPKNQKNIELEEYCPAAS